MAFKNNSYQKLTKPEDKIKLGSLKEIRLGAWGDPTSVPVEELELLLTETPGHSGYTQNWEQFSEFRHYLMASVCSLEQAKKAWKLGCRTYRIKPKEEKPQDNEIQCPHEKNKRKIKCLNCPIPCNGLSSGIKHSITCDPGGRSTKKLLQNIGDIQCHLTQTPEVSLKTL